MNTFLFSAIVLLAILAIAFVAFGRENTWETLAGPVDTGPIDLRNLKRTGRPNDGLICSPGHCPPGLEPNLEVEPVELLPGEIISRIEKRLQSNDVLFKRVDDRSDNNRIRFITWSPLMRFPDLNEFVLIEDATGKTAIVAYARAQVGYSDRGQNLKRLKMLIENLN